MSGVRFVRLYPSDWRSGCIGLTLEQEGLYIRVCTFIFETERRLPVDDGAAAKFMGLHTNAYRKVRDQLAALGKLTRHADGWTVARAERELAAASYQKREAERQADQNTPGDTRQDTLGDTPPDTPIDTPPESMGVISEKQNKINSPIKSHNHSLSQREESRPVRSEQEAAPAKADGASEISGLNGSTSEIVTGIAKFLNVHCPDQDAARRIVASNVGLYGSDAVRDGYAELMADVADNKVRVPSVKALVGYFKTAGDRRDKPRRDQSNRPQWAVERDDQLAKFKAALKTYQ